MVGKFVEALELGLGVWSKNCISLKFRGLFHFEGELWSRFKGG